MPDRPEAESKKPSVPLLVNFSFGLGAGSHNGTHPIEQCLAEMTTMRDPSDPVYPVHVVLPAGNRFQEKGHASVLARKGGEHELSLDWMIPAGDRSPNFLEIWIPSDATKASVQLSLHGTTIKCSGFGSVDRFPLDQGAVALCHEINGHANTDEAVAWATAIEDPNPGQDGTKRTRIFVAVAPTEYPRSDVPLAPPGIWQITLRATLQDRQTMEAWVQRDERPFGYRRPGKQSYLIENRDDRHEILKQELDENSRIVLGKGSVSGYGTLNGIATNLNLTVVAGYRWRDQSPASYSAAGSFSVRAPNLAAVSDRSRIEAGVLAAGSRSGSSIALNGTSVAVPQMVRVLAERYQSKSDIVSDAETVAKKNNVTHSVTERVKADFRGMENILEPTGRLKSQLDATWPQDRLVRQGNL